MALDLGTLYSTIQLNMSNFNTGINQAKSGLSSVGSKGQATWQGLADGLGALGMKLMPISAAIVAVGTATIGAALSASKFAQDIEHLSQTTGLSTTTLQKFRGVTNMVGLDFEAFAGASTMVQRKLLGVENDSNMAAKVFDKLGVSIYDSSGEIKSMDELFPQLIEKLQAMPNITERNAMATAVFGRNLAAIAPVLGLTTKEMNEAMKASGVMTESQIKDAVKFQQQVNLLKAKLSSMARTIGTEFIPILRDTVAPILENTVIPALKMIIKVIADVAKAFAHLPKGVQVGIMAVLGLLAAAGPTLLVVGKVISKIGAFVEAAPAMGAAISAIVEACSGPIGWVILAITAIVALIGIMYAKSKPFKDAVGSLWTNLKKLFSEVWEALKKLWTAMQPLVQLWAKWQGIQFGLAFKGLELILRVIVMALSQMIELLTKTVEIWSLLLTTLTKGRGMTFIERLLDTTIKAVEAAKTHSTVLKEQARQARLASEEEAKSVLDIVQKRRDAAEEQRKQAMQAVGFMQSTDIWQKAMIAGAKAEIGGKIDTKISTTNLPQGKELNEILKELKRQTKEVEDLNRITRERLGLYGA